MPQQTSAYVTLYFCVFEFTVLSGLQKKKHFVASFQYLGFIHNPYNNVRCQTG